MFTYLRGKKDGRKGLTMYAARRREERVYICTRREGRKKGFIYVRGKNGRKDLHMYAARRTEERVYICSRQEGRKKDINMYASRRREERI